MNKQVRDIAVQVDLFHNNHPRFVKGMLAVVQTLIKTGVIKHSEIDAFRRAANVNACHYDGWFQNAIAEDAGKPTAKQFCDDMDAKERYDHMQRYGHTDLLDQYQG